MLLFKLLNRCLLVLACWVGAAGGAWAQAPSACATTPQPACTFVAINTLTNQEVTSFCVGVPVRFEQCPGRNVPTTLLYYGVRPGTGAAADFPNCTPPNPQAPTPYIYTPTRAEVGTVTVSELATVLPPATTGSTYYTRSFRVYDNVAPTFTVAPCPSNTALVTVTDLTYDAYTVQAGSGAPLPIVKGQRTVVPLNGATALTVRGYYTAPNACESLPATQNVTPLPAAQVPLLTNLTLQAPLPGGNATLAVGQLPAGYTYTLQRADASVPGGYATVTSVAPGSTSLSLTNPPAGCYRLRRTDPCRLDSAFSPLVCTLSLAGSSAQNRNQLLFTDGGRPATTYTVTRNGAAYTGFTVTSTGLEDADVTCGTSYTYVVTSRYPSGVTSVSNPVTVLTASSLPPAQPRVVASFNLNNVVEVRPLLATPALPTGATLRYRRTVGNAAPADFGSANTLRPQRDSTALADLRAAPPCYTVRLEDVCGNVSPESSASCPALLSATAADPAGSTAALTWTPFTGPTPGAPATYALETLGANGQVLSSVAVSGSSYTDLTPPTDRQVLRYRLKISGAGLPAGVFSYSNVATVTRELFLTIPTAFTPNGDGLNDVLEVKGKYLKDYTFVVVDRNGVEVFRGSQRADTWDGTIRGHAPVLGAYVWRFSQTNEDGTPFTATGSVTILK